MKKELPLEILRYPLRDDELWAFTFVKKVTLFKGSFFERTKGGLR